MVIAVQKFLYVYHEGQSTALVKAESMCSHRLNLISPVKYNYKILQCNVNTCTCKHIQNQVTEVPCRKMYVQILTLEDCLHLYTSTYTSSNVQLWEQEEKHNFDFSIDHED